ncbi:MAG: ATP-binding cassette domain-containing protein [Candidatus Bipolaricaulota bacterium]|nr:ATP-binding cassette domain-containing protein [Candidatus Bipolaricaulota bacterium]
MNRHEVVMEATGIRKSLGGTIVLRDANLEVRNGEVHGLIGPNGSGKTTLVNVVTGLWRPDAGKVTIGGVDVTDMSPERIASGGPSKSRGSTAG